MLLDLPPEVLEILVSFVTCSELGNVYLVLSRYHFSVLCSRGWQVLAERYMRLFSSISGTYRELLYETTLFRDPHGTNSLGFIYTGEEVAYFKAGIRLDSVTEGILIEVWVHFESNSLSISFVDFDGKGSSSVTFSPNEGFVIKERKLLMDSNTVDGQYAECMSPSPKFGKRKTGARIGMYLDRNLGIEFFRSTTKRRIETTGIISDCSWVHGGVVTPCVSFSGPGKYDVRIETMRVMNRPKSWPRLKKTEQSYEWKNTSWSN